MRAFILFAITAFVGPFARSCAEPANNYVLSLNSDNPIGSGWTVENQNGSIRATATVPGGIYSDLMNGGIIDDVYFKDNDVKTRWISKTDWIYKRTFNVSSEILEKETVDIVFHGLDTIAFVSINDHPVAMTENMFMRFKFNIKQYLQVGINEVAILFESPVLKAASLSENEMIPPECVPAVYNGECHANQLRKMQASFSWDWGPALPSVGIWKPINLEAYNSAIIRDILTDAKYIESDAAWNLTLKVYLDVSGGISDLEGHLQASIALENGVILRTYKFVKDSVLKRDVLEKELSIQISNADAKRWWPNGYGEQALYNVTVTFQSTQFVDEFFFKTIKTGFRTLELIQESYGDGLTFYFRVNGHPIFMKGSNWIPGKILPEHGYEEDMVDNLLGAAQVIHMNMLRVWGGGVYESDYFYQKCDELGLLVWQDMMFACGMYPANSKFLSSVQEEVEQVVKRLQHHPSIAIWAGNNENEVALRGNWYSTESNFTHYKDEYIKLYVESIRPVVQKIDPTRTYVVSSPSNGIKSEEDGYIAENPGDSRFGDTHYYNYLSDLWSMDTYPKARFCSEYGFQSVPSIETLSTATDDPNDLHVESDFMQHREHSDSNNYDNMLMQIVMQFGLLDIFDPNYTAIFQFYTQVIQAWAYKTETEFYRQSRDDWMTMGALYWQLNDVWQAPTWSGIEFNGYWKMLHYYGKDFFSPVLISPRHLLTNEIKVHIINDNLQEILNATVVIEQFNWDSMTPIDTQTSQVDIKPLSAEEFGNNIELPAAAERKLIYYRFSLKDANSNLLSPYNYIFPVKLKDIEGYRVPNVTYEILNVSGEGPEYDVIVKTDGVGLFVWLQIEHDVGFLSENGFIMSDKEKRLKLYVVTRKNLAKLKNLQLKIFDPRHFTEHMEVKQVERK